MAHWFFESKLKRTEHFAFINWSLKFLSCFPNKFCSHCLLILSWDYFLVDLYNPFRCLYVCHITQQQANFQPFEIRLENGTSSACDCERKNQNNHNNRCNHFFPIKFYEWRMLRLILTYCVVDNFSFVQICFSDGFDRIEKKWEYTQWAPFNSNDFGCLDILNAI